MSRRAAEFGLVGALIVICFLSFLGSGDSPTAPELPPPEPGEGSTTAPAPVVSNPDLPSRAGAPKHDRAKDPGGTAESESHDESLPWAEMGWDRKGRPLTGRVVRADGAPVEGAVVSVYQRHEDIYRKGVRPSGIHARTPLQARTGNDGRYRFDPERVIRSRGRYGHVTWTLVRAQGIGSISRCQSILPHLAGLDMPDLVLSPAVRPEGRIVNDRGRPVANAHVSLTFSEPTGGSKPRERQYFTVADRTDDEGRVRFSPVARRDDWNVRLIVKCRGYVTIERPIPLAEVASNSPFHATIPAGLTVRGILLHPDGTPAAKYDVRVGRRPDRPSGDPVARTGEDGSFLARGVPSKSGVLGFRKEYGELPHRIDVPVEAHGDVIDLGRIRLPGGRIIRGVVRDESGEPLKCRVQLRRPGTRYECMFPDPREGGRFTFTRVPPGEYVLEASVEATPGDRIEGRVTGVRPGDEAVVIRLSRAYSVLFVFHAADRPEEPLEIYAPGIGWEGHGIGVFRRLSRLRLYLPPGPEMHRFTVEVPGYSKVTLPPVRLLSDGEVVVDVCLANE